MGGKLTTTPIRQIQSVRELFGNAHVHESLASVATAHLGPERLLRVAMGACQTTPQLLDCTPMSFLRALVTCAKLGLEPNNEFGHVYLIPFRNKRAGVTECQLIPGYKGFMELALRHPAVVAIHADVVYSDDEMWEYEYGSEMRLRHRPGPRDGEPTHAYCYVKLRDGQAFTVMPWAEILRRRDASQGYRYAESTGKKDSPWHTHLLKMARKTPIREMAAGGELPMATEMMDLLLADEGKLPPIELDARGRVVEGVAREPEGDAEPEEKHATDDPKRPASGEPATRAQRNRKPEEQPRREAKPARTDAPEDEGHGWSEPGIDPETGLPEVVVGVMRRIIDEISEAESESELTGVEAIWDDEIRAIREASPDAGQQISDALEAAREKLTGGA